MINFKAVKEEEEEEECNANGENMYLFYKVAIRTGIDKKFQKHSSTYECNVH